MLTNSLVVRSPGPRVLFLVGAVVTAAILLWMHQMRLSGELHGLTTIFFVLYAHEDYGGVVCALVILMLAAVVPVGPPARRLLGWAGGHPWIIAAASAVVLILGALFVYHDHPLSMDEYAAYFQSRAFAAGHLTGTFPLPLMDWLIPPGFQDYFLDVSHTSGAVASSYWPSFALILTPFMWAGIPWVCNPLISALTLLAIHKLAMEIFADREAAGTALLLTVASPVFFANGISYYSMPAHLLANSVFALLLLKPTIRRAFTAGVIGSVALTLHNPVPHILFAIPWLVWILTRPDRAGLFGALCMGYAPLCALLGLGWFWFSGRLTHEGLAVVAGSSAGLQRISSAFGIPTATVFLARLIGAAKIWLWGVPGLLLLACIGGWRTRASKPCGLFAASALLTFVGYLFVTVDQGHGWGYRYFHSAWMALPLLATAALYRPGSMRDVADASADAAPIGMFENPATKSYVAVCILLTLVFGVGWRAWQMQGFMAGDLSQLPHYQGTERRIVIIDNRFSFYGADLVQNDPWLRGNEIRMFSHGTAEDKKMMAQYYPTWHQVYADRFGTVWAAGH